MVEEISEKKQAPIPPPKEISIRTMESDIKMMKSGGGEIPTYKPVLVAQQPEVQSEINIPGYVGPEKSIFKASGEVINQPTNLIGNDKKFDWKPLVMIVVAAAAIIGLGLIGYFILPKLLFK